MRSNKMLQGRKQSIVKFAVAGAVASLLGAATVASAATPPPANQTDNQFFDWFVNGTPGYLASPFLTDANAGSVNAFLLSQANSGKPLAVKIMAPISNATSNLIFNNSKYNVSYVLGDVETGANSVNDLKELAEQVRFVNGANNGTKTNSHNAFIGNFGFSGIPSDKTHPANYKKDKKDKHSFAGFNNGDFASAKLNMAMPELYPGSPSQRNLAAGNLSSPNIRSGLFAVPIVRLSQTTVNAADTTQVVPYIARFNNWNNLALDTDRNASNGYKFVPGQAIPAGGGFPALTAAQTTDQMLSRRDFAAQVAHYRLRGADSYVAFDGGVQGYLQDQKRSDAKAGWTLPQIDQIFNAADAKILIGADTDYKNGKDKKDINGNIVIDGKDTPIENAGALFSGVYSLTLQKMEVLLSNMDDEAHDLTLPSKIAGFDLKSRTFDVDGGQHLLVEYKLTTSGVNRGWSVASTVVPWQAIENSRHGIGIPEPTTISLAALAGFFAISRRRRTPGTPAAARGESPAQPQRTPAAACPMGLVGLNVTEADVRLI